MAREPWFKFWAADYLTDPDVDSLPLEAQALLLRMWCACWLYNGIPNDVGEIARLTHCQTQWVTQWLTQCLTHFIIRDGRLFSPRMEREKAKSAEGRAAAQRRWNKQVTDTIRTPIGLPNGSPNAKPNAQKAREFAAEKDAAKFVLPVWMPEGAWSAYCVMRTKSRKPMTDRARELVIGKLEKFMNQGQDIEQILNQSVIGNWTDVYALKEQSNGKEPSKVQQRIASNREKLDQGRRDFLAGNSLDGFDSPDLRHGDPDSGSNTLVVGTSKRLLP